MVLRFVPGFAKLLRNFTIYRTLAAISAKEIVVRRKKGNVMDVLLEGFERDELFFCIPEIIDGWMKNPIRNLRDENNNTAGAKLTICKDRFLRKEIVCDALVFEKDGKMVISKFKEAPEELKEAQKQQPTPVGSH